MTLIVVCSSSQVSTIIEENLLVLDVIESYPSAVKVKLLHIREIILRLSLESENVESLEETLKWGEPSYISNVGSTIRLGWRKKNPNFYYVYFICSTKLIDTFRELYADVFKFEGNRAIVFEVTDEIPEKPLSHCLEIALSYHSLKHLPLLGA